MSLNVKSMFHLLYNHSLSLYEKSDRKDVHVDAFCFDSTMDINPMGEYLRKTAKLTKRSIALVLFLFDINK